ncbi:MAG: ureidoacrylate peracid hydrolase [Rhodobacteraceae bacterium HLUCCA12]|nr:MAG: ureidoacrylate peracid hydrolase [Rhodobacteraceae bacterium HLUCCA12]
MSQLRARPEPVTLSAQDTALIVVDMQNAFASPGGMFDLAGHDISGAGPVVEQLERLLPALRAAQVPIIYLQMAFKPDLSDAGGPDSPAYHKELALRMMRERPELSGKLLVEGSWDWQFVDRVAPKTGDLVIRKSRYNGFTGSDLAKTLTARGIRHLLFCGIATNICVESTARSAFFNEFWPILIADAMNHAGPDFTRQATLWNFENVLGWVSDSAAVLQRFSQP